MKNNPFLCCLIIALAAVSCQKSRQPSDLSALNGYWGIQRVKQASGEVKTYKANPTVDYIEIDSTGKGLRTKVKPKFDGSFKNTGDVEKFKVTEENDSLRFHYKTELDSWTETLLSLDKDQFSVKNKRGMVYTYKRFESLKKQLKAHEHAQ